MRIKHVVCGLVVVALMGGGSTQARAEFFPWWAFDSVLEEVQDRGTLRVGLGLFEPSSACNADGELIGFEIDVATKVAADIGVAVAFARTNWNYIISALIAEEFDVIINSMTILPHRNLRVNFTVPYNALSLYLVAHMEQTTALATLADLQHTHRVRPRVIIFVEDLDRCFYERGIDPRSSGVGYGGFGTFK